jgi:glycosyltransferase involved in cell wall biosynthesis
MRGIGYTTTNFLENLPSTDKDEYVFFLDDSAKMSDDEVFEQLDIQIPYNTRHFNGSVTKKLLPWKFRYLSKLVYKFSSMTIYRIGDRRYDVSNLDAFIQFDQSKPLPAGPKRMKKYFIAYDLIPYILKKDYLVDYHTARQKGLNKRASLRSAIDRYVYLKKVKLNCKKADGIIAISETTKQDYMRYCGVSASKISIVTLGVSDMLASASHATGVVDRYQKTSWGYIPHHTSLTGKDFLLFVGGADDRRRLHDLVAAFNHLKAQGSDLKLVLSGDIMKGPLEIPTVNIQKALLGSSYLDDIYFVGFADNATRNWLYQHAVAFVFPSVYEGFGLPVLEAMSLKTPVICYKNQAVQEVASNTPFYAHDTLSLIDRIREVQSLAKSDKLQTLLAKGASRANKFTWQQTAQGVVDLLYK